MLGAFDSANYSRPEPRPVGGLGTVLSNAQGALQERSNSPDILGLALASRTLAQVCGNRPGRFAFECAVEKGPDAATGE
jgi:hypothetical protein